MWGSEADRLQFGGIYPLWYGDAAVRSRPAAVARLTALADKGYAPAQYALAMAYFDGDGVRRDYKRAYRLALAGAAQQYPAAENMVGSFHAMAQPKHDACVHDPADAVRWYVRAAERGDPGAMMNLVNCYQSGLGVDADAVEVFVWASLTVHCSPIRNRGAETISERTGATLTKEQRAAADDRIARMKAALPHPWSTHLVYWKSLAAGAGAIS